MMMMESEPLSWEVERAELRLEMSRLEEELSESRAEKEELKLRMNLLTERLSQTLDASVSVGWEVEQREWRRKLRESGERETRQALLIHKLQQKVVEYKTRHETLQQRLRSGQNETSNKERILLEERSDYLENTLIRLEEEQQRSVTLVEVNALLRSQLSQSAGENQSLQEDLRKVTSDWSEAVEEAKRKETEWSRERESLCGTLAAARSRLMPLWSQAVALRQECHIVKTATDKDLWELRAEFSRLSSTLVSSGFLSAVSTDSPSALADSARPPSSPLSSTSGPMMLSELDAKIRADELNNRISTLTETLKSHELEKQHQVEEMERRSRAETEERDRLREKYEEMERNYQTVRKTLVKLYRVVGSQRPNGRSRDLPPGSDGFGEDVHSLLSIITNAESVVQRQKHEIQKADWRCNKLKAEAELLRQQLEDLTKEKTDVQEKVDEKATELHLTHSMLNSEKETALSLRSQLHDAEQHSTELKQENTRLLQQRERDERERSKQEAERRRRIQSKTMESVQLCEHEVSTRLELHRLRVALEQEKRERESAEREAISFREALTKARESLQSLSSTNTLLQREAADARGSLQKMAALNESLVQNKRELTAESSQFENEIAEYEVQLQSFRSDVASFQKKLDTMSEINMELRNSRDEALDSIHQLRDRERKVKRELQQIKDENQRIDTELTEERDKNLLLSEQYSSVCEELSSVRAALDKLMEQDTQTQRERDELQRESQQLKTELQIRLEENEEVTQDREELRGLCETLQQQLGGAKEHNSEMQLQNTQLQMHADTLQQAKNVLRGEITCLQSELERSACLREKVQCQMNEDRTKLEEEIKTCQSEIQRLQTSAERASEQQKHLDEKWQEERETLSLELGVKDGDLSALRNRMESLVIENQRLSVLLDESKDDAEKLSVEIKSLELRMQAAKEELDEWKEQVTNIQEEKHGLLQQLNQERENLNIKEGERAKLCDLLQIRDEELKNNCGQIQELLIKLQSQEDQMEKLRREWEEKDVEFVAKLNEESAKEEKLKEELKEVQKEKQHISDLLQEKETELKKLCSKATNQENTNREVSDQLERWKTRAGDVEKERNSLLTRIDHLTSVEQERDRLEQALIQKDRKIEKLNKDIQERVLEVETMEEALGEAKRMLKRKDREVADHQHEIERILKENQEQEQKWKLQLEEVENEKVSLEDRGKEQKARQQAMEADLSKMSEKLDGLTKENMEIKRKEVDGENQREILETELHALRKVFGELKQQLENTKLERETERNLRMDCEHRLEIASEKVDREVGRVKELEERGRRFTEEADVLRRTLEERSRDVEKEKVRVQEMETVLGGLNQRIKIGAGELEQLKTSIVEKESEIGRLKLEVQGHELQLSFKESEFISFKERTDSVLKQKEENLKKVVGKKEQVGAELARLKEDLTATSLSKEQLQTTVKERDEELHALRKIVEEMKQRLEDTEVERERERNLRMDADHRLQISSVRLDQEEGKVKDLEEQGRRFVEELDFLRKTLEERSRDVERETVRMQEMEKVVGSLNQKIEIGVAEREELKASIAEKENEIGRLKLEVQSHQLELISKEGQFGSFRKRTDSALKQKEENLKEMRGKSEQMEAEVTKLKEDLTAVSLSKEQLEAMVKERDVELHALSEVVAELKEQLEDTEMERKREIKLHFESDNRLQIASERLNQEEAKVKELEEQGRRFIDEADMLRKTLEGRSKDLEREMVRVQEMEVVVRGLTQAVKNGTEEQKQLKTSISEKEGEIGRLKLQVQDYQLELGSKEGEFVAFKQKTDSVLKQKEENLKEAREQREKMKAEVAKLKEDLTTVSSSKDQLQTMVKERDEENNRIKAELKDGLKEMLTLKELLEENHREGQMLRKILESKKNEIMEGREEEVLVLKDEANRLSLRVQLLQRENQELQAQLCIREQDLRDVREEVWKMERVVTEKNKLLKNWKDLLKGENRKVCELEKARVLDLITQDLREKDSRMKNMEGNQRRYELIEEELREKVGVVDVLNRHFREKETNLTLLEEPNQKDCSFDATKQETVDGTIREEAENGSYGQFQLAQRDTKVLKSHSNRKLLENADNRLEYEEHPLQGSPESTLRENEDSTGTPMMETEQFQDSIQHKELCSYSTEKELELYELKERAEQLRKERDHFRLAMEKNEALLIHYKEKSNELEKEVQRIRSRSVEDASTELNAQERVFTLQRAVAELEVQIKILQQRNKRLEQHVAKLRTERRSLREALAQERSVSGEAGDPRNMKARAGELCQQVQHLQQLLASDHQKWAEFIDRSVKNSESMQSLRQDLNHSLSVVSKELVPPVLKSETQRLDRSIRAEQLKHPNNSDQ